MSSYRGIQLWRVPVTGQYDITIAGAGGGRSYIADETQREGYGAKIDLSAVLHKGDVYRILIGQKGLLGNNDSDLEAGYTNYMPYSSSGGGATFFVKDATYDESTFIDNTGLEIGDVSQYVIAVAGGGSGGRTWTRDDDQYDASINVTNASIDPDFLGKTGFYTEGESRTKISVTQIAPRGYNSLSTEDREYFGEIDFGGGGGGGGLIKYGGMAGDGGSGGNYNGSVGSQPAFSFFYGGTGGLNQYNPDGGGIGNVKTGWFWWR